MIRGVDFVAKYPEYFKIALPAADLHLEVTQQAKTHTRRCSGNELVDAARPHELDVVKEYRNNNRRMISKEGVDRFHSATSRIIDESGSSFQDLSEALSEWLDSNPFKVLKRAVGWKEYIYNCVYPTSIEDPNGVLTAFPFSTINSSIPPSYSESEGGQPRNERVGVKPLIIYSEEIRWNSDGIFSFEAGEWEYTTVRNKKAKAPYYFIVDSDNWYRYYPKGYSTKEKRLVYELELWYFHNTGEVPVSILPGCVATSELGNHVKYNESFLHTYFEYADEYNVRLDDSKIVWVQNCSPITAMREMPCLNPDCNKLGFVITKNEQGEPVGTTKCQMCDNGVMKNINPRDLLIIPDGSNFEKQSNTDLVQFYSPSQGILDIALKNPDEWLAKAKQAIGLDALEKSGESSLAMEKRYEPLKDMLKKVGYGLLNNFESFLWHAECLLQTEKSNRIKPKAVIPQTYKVKDLNGLLEDAKNALPVNLFHATLQVIKKKYPGDIKTQKVHEYALLYAPLLMYDPTQRKDKIISGAYDETDDVRADYATCAMMEVCEEIGLDKFLDLSKKEVMQIAEDYLVDLGVIDAPIELFDGSIDRTQGAEQNQ